MGDARGPARPLNVTETVALLWILTLPLTFIGIALLVPSWGVADGLGLDDSAIPVPVLAVLNLAYAVLMGVLAVMLARGRDWARLSVIGLAGLTLAVSLYPLFTRGMVNGVVVAAMFGVPVILCLSTGKGRQWFRDREQHRERLRRKAHRDSQRKSGP